MDLRQCYSLTDLRQLSNLEHLVSIDVSDSNVTDVAWLAGLTQLQALHVTFNNPDVVDFSVLMAMTELKELHVSVNDDIDMMAVDLPMACMKLQVGWPKLPNCFPRLIFFFRAL